MAAVSSLCFFISSQFAPVMADQGAAPAHSSESGQPPAATGQPGSSGAAPVMVVNQRTVAGLTNLTVDPNTVVVINFANLAGNVTLPGNVVNAGTIYALSTNPAVTSGLLSANNIFNNSGAVISSILPAGGIGCFTPESLVSGFNLSLSALNNIVNNGTISSAGSLSMTAGGQITNTANISAVSDLNMSAANIVNSGLIASQTGSLTAATASVNNSGIMQALAGSINIMNLLGQTLSVNNVSGQIRAGDKVVFETLASILNPAGGYISKGLIELDGGDVSGGSVNFNSPDGQVTVGAKSISGPVNVSAGAVFLGVDEGELLINELILTGDPIFWNKTASITITQTMFNQALSNPGQNWVFLSGRDINTNVAAGSTFNAGSGLFGSIVMGAGVTFSPPLTISGSSNTAVPIYSISSAPSSTGGSINLSGINLQTVGKDVTLIARAVNAGTGNVSIGNITTSSSSNNAGNVSINADRNISTGAITANGGAGSSLSPAGSRGGDISIISNAANAANLGGFVQVGAIASRGGAGFSYLLPGFANGGNAGNGGNVVVTTNNKSGVAQNLTTSTIDTSGGGGGQGGFGLLFAGSGGKGGSAGQVNLTVTGPGDVNVNGAVTANGGTGGNGSTSLIGAVGNGGNGGNAGPVNVGTQQGNINLNSPVTSNAGSGGAPGQPSGSAGTPGAEATIALSTTTGSILGGGLLSANTVTFNSTSGEVGQNGSPINTHTNNIVANTGGSGSVYVSNDKSVAISGDSSAGASFDLSADGNLTVDGKVNAANVALSTQSITDGHIVLNKDVTGTSQVFLLTDGPGNVTINQAVNSVGGLVKVIANDVIINGSINGGSTGVVELAPNDDKSIAFAGGGATFNVDVSDLNKITAQLLSVGNLLHSGGLTVVGDYDISNRYNLYLGNRGTITATGHVTTIGGKHLDMEANGTIRTGGISGGETVVTVNSHEADIVIDGAITLAAVNSTVSLHANSNITQSTGTVTAANLTATSDEGNIGNINTNISFLVANAAGDVEITNNSSVVGSTLTVNDESSSGNDFTVKTNRNLSVTAGITAGHDFKLQTTGNNGAISLGADVEADNKLTVSANGSGSITQTAGYKATGTDVILQSGSGNIGSGTSSRVNVVAGTLKVDTTGNVWVQAEGGTRLLVSSAGNNKVFDLTSTGNGDIEIAGDVKAGTGTIGTINIDADGNGDIKDDGGTLVAKNVNLSSDNGDIGENGGARVRTDADNLSANTGGDVYLTNKGSVTLKNSSAGDHNTFDLVTTSNGTIRLDGNVKAAFGTIDRINLSADGHGNIYRDSGTLYAHLVDLSSDDGDIGKSFARIRVDACELSANTEGDVYLRSEGSIRVLDSSAGNSETFDLETRNGGNIILDGDIAAGFGRIGTISLSADGNGDIRRESGELVAQNIELQADNGDIGEDCERIRTDAWFLSANTEGSVYIRQNGSVVLLSSSAGQDEVFDLKTRNDGSITIAGGISSSNGGSIGTVSLNADGSGDIETFFGWVGGQKVVLRSGYGDIGGGVFSPLRVDADRLSAKTSGDVYLFNSGDVVLLSSHAGGSETFSLVTFGSIRTARYSEIYAGDIVLVTPELTLGRCSTIEAENGDLLIQGVGSLNVSMHSHSELIASGDIVFNPIFGGAITVSGGPNHGVMSAENIVFIGGGSEEGVDVNVRRIDGVIQVFNVNKADVSIITSHGDLQLGSDIDTSASATHPGSAGDITLMANGGSILAVDRLLLSQGFGDDNSGGTISLAAAHDINIGLLDARGFDGADGGTIIDPSENLLVTLVNNNGASIDVSSVGGQGGSISITTTSQNTFHVFNPSQNGTAGSILANGVSGGRIDLILNGALSVNSPPPLPLELTNNPVIFIQANGTTGDGGIVLIQVPHAESGYDVFVSQRALIGATNTAGTSGKVGIHVGPDGDLNLGGPGTIFGGDFFNLGNLDTDSLELLDVKAGFLTFSLAGYGNKVGCNFINCPNFFPTGGTLATTTAPLAESPEPRTLNLPQFPFANSLLPTDLTPGRKPGFPSDNKVEVITLVEQLAETDQVWVIVTNKTQPYDLPGDSQCVILAAPGTVFALTGDHQITLKQGSLTILTGGAGLDVQTAHGLVSIKPDSASGVAQNMFGVVTVAQLLGNPAEFDVSNNGESARLTIAVGQELNLLGSNVATAGTSDFANNPDLLAGPVSGLSSANGKIDYLNSGFLKDLSGCEGYNLTSAQRHNLLMLLRFSLHAMGNQTNTGPKAYLERKPDHVQDNPQQAEPLFRAALDSNASYLVPVSHMSPGAMAAGNALEEVKILRTSEGELRYAGKAQVMPGQDGAIVLKGGDVLFTARKSAVIQAASCTLQIGRGATVLVGLNENIVKVRNLMEKSPESVQVVFGGRSVRLCAGREIAVGSGEQAVLASMKQDGIARRRMQTIALPGGLTSSSGEFSMVSVLRRNHLLRDLSYSSDRSDRSLYGRFIKMGACLSVVTAARGPYR